MSLALRVEGMTCQHCVRAVTAAIVALDPGAVVTVDLAARLVTAETKAERAAVVAAVQAEGYGVAG